MAGTRIYWLDHASGCSGPITEEDGGVLEEVFARFGIGDVLTIEDDKSGFRVAKLSLPKGGISPFTGSRELKTGDEGVQPLLEAVRDHFPPRPGKRDDWGPSRCYVALGGHTGDRSYWSVRGTVYKLGEHMGFLDYSEGGRPDARIWV